MSDDSSVSTASRAHVYLYADAFTTHALELHQTVEHNNSLLEFNIYYYICTPVVFFTRRAMVMQYSSLLRIVI